MPKKGECVKFKNYERKIKSLFAIHGDFEIILVPENNGKNIPAESYASQFQKRIVSSYEYKLVCVNDKFCNPFKAYFGKDAVYNFINSMIKESKYCNEVMKKEFIMTKSTTMILRTQPNPGTVIMIILILMLK